MFADIDLLDDADFTEGAEPVKFFYLTDDAIIRFQMLCFFLGLPFGPTLQEFLAHGA